MTDKQEINTGRIEALIASMKDGDLGLEDAVELLDLLVAEREQQPEPEEDALWRAERGQEYYSISAEGYVSECLEYFDDNDKCRYERGNYYRTKEQAQAAADHQALWGPINNKAIELRGDWRPDWSDGNQRKYFMDFNIGEQRFKMYDDSCEQGPYVYLHYDGCSQLLYWANKHHAARFKERSE